MKTKILRIKDSTTSFESYGLDTNQEVFVGDTKIINNKGEWVGTLEGIKGYKGIEGIIGDNGPQGPQGDKGIKGQTGDKGPQGDKGNKGLKGEEGIKGQIGPTGNSGDAGDKGLKGLKGLLGPKGLLGDKGIKGQNGDKGLKGLKGIVGEDGSPANKGDKGEFGDLNDSGDKGTTGDKGDKGPAGPSDKRLKENIIEITDSLQKVISLRGVEFIWREENLLGKPLADAGRKDIGFIAQEVKEVLPEVVLGDEESGYTLQYGQIISLLFEAIKEQEKILDDRETEIEELEKKIL